MLVYCNFPKEVRLGGLGTEGLKASKLECVCGSIYLGLKGI